jgi:futalosine hydrolase
LVLVPTRMEADELGLDGTAVELCGFGLAAAGVHAAGAIARHRPDRVILAGLAGTYDGEAAPLGTAVRAGVVRCVGIGAGGRSAAELGFADSDDVTLEDTGPLALSVASASATPAEAGERAVRNPGAVLEEMEGYAVALAATEALVPCLMVRGISNRAGDRDASGWDIRGALAAVREALSTILPR